MFDEWCGVVFVLVCVLVLGFGEVVVCGEWFGMIVCELCGDGGFGYDLVFVLYGDDCIVV